MSTTVTYKGASIATVSNATKKLLTSGKYMEDDITLTDVSGGGSTLGTKSVTANGTYNASSDNLDGYSQVTVNVSGVTQYDVTQTLTSVTSSTNAIKATAGESFFCELTPAAGYVISTITVTMGGVDITSQVFKAALGTKTITANNTYDAADDDLSGYSSVTVNVPTGITPTGTKQIAITSNGTTTEDVTSYASAEITANVPNTYTSGDEGKVVSNGSLVSQTSDTVTANDTYDTTLINSLTVNVSGGGSDIEFVEYISTSGSAWLDTGVKANQTSIIDAVFYGTATSSTLYGCASSGNSASVSLIVNGTTASNCRFGNRAASQAVAINTLMNTHQQLSVLCVNTTYKTYTAASNFETPKTLLLGATYNSSGNVDSWHFQGRIYYFRHIKDGAVAFDGRPAKKNNVYGIYDMVSKTFMPSITGTNFAGHDYS